MSHCYSLCYRNSVDLKVQKKIIEDCKIPLERDTSGVEILGKDTEVHV